MRFFLGDGPPPVLRRVNRDCGVIAAWGQARNGEGKKWLGAWGVGYWAGFSLRDSAAEMRRGNGKRAETLLYKGKL